MRRWPTSPPSRRSSSARPSPRPPSTGAPSAPSSASRSPAGSAPERRARRWPLGGLPAALAAGLAVIALYLAIPGGNSRAPVGDQAAAENAMLASRLDLIKELDLVQRLDLLEDFDVIGRLDGAESSEKS